MFSALNIFHISRISDSVLIVSLCAKQAFCCCAVMHCLASWPSKSRLGSKDDKDKEDNNLFGLQAHQKGNSLFPDVFWSQPKSIYFLWWFKGLSPFETDRCFIYISISSMFFNFVLVCHLPLSLASPLTVLDFASPDGGLTWHHSGTSNNIFINVRFLCT